MRQDSGIPILVLLCILFASCSELANPIDTSYYYWKTVYKLDSTEQSALKNIGAKRLFIRIMDIDNQGRNGEAIPISAIKFEEPLPDSVALVPVVYIVNNVLKDLSNRNLDSLAANIFRFVKGKVKQSGKESFDEIQLDCDWTASTRDNYFTLLKAIRNQLADSVRLTSTLRLHQVRNLRTSGIPPVDRVLLMCYNMGNLRKYGEHNSILDLKEMDTYLNRFLQEYPLPMDIALPLFSWSVVFRDQNYIGISKSLNAELLKDTTLFSNQPKSSIYQLKTDLPKYRLRHGDEVRYEETHLKELYQAAEFLAKHKKKEEFTILFYHLDSQVLQNFSNEQIKEIKHRF